jgi:hypothetical protein
VVDGAWILADVRFSSVFIAPLPGEAGKYDFGGQCSGCCIMNGELAVGATVKFKHVLVLCRGWSLPSASCATVDERLLRSQNSTHSPSLIYFSRSFSFFLFGAPYRI